MYRNSESFSVVKKILAESIPQTVALKIREEEEVLIVVSHQKNFFLLNEVAKDFYILCDGKRKFNQIIDELCEIYDVDREILTDDLIDVIQDFQYKRILRVEAA